eukprot:sb/3475081/
MLIPSFLNSPDHTSSYLWIGHHRFFLISNSFPKSAFDLVNCTFQDLQQVKKTIKTRYLGHVTGYQPIRDQYLISQVYIQSHPQHSSGPIIIILQCHSAIPPDFPVNLQLRRLRNKIKKRDTSIICKIVEF